MSWPNMYEVDSQFNCCTFLDTEDAEKEKRQEDWRGFVFEAVLNNSHDGIANAFEGSNAAGRKLACFPSCTLPWLYLYLLIRVYLQRTSFASESGSVLLSSRKSISLVNDIPARQYIAVCSRPLESEPTLIQ